jgi:hypothetical protein
MPRSPRPGPTRPHCPAACFSPPSGGPSGEFVTDSGRRRVFAGPSPAPPGRKRRFRGSRAQAEKIIGVMIRAWLQARATGPFSGQVAARGSRQRPGQGRQRQGREEDHREIDAELRPRRAACGRATGHLRCSRSLRLSLAVEVETRRRERRDGLHTTRSAPSASAAFSAASRRVLAAEMRVRIGCSATMRSSRLRVLVPGKSRRSVVGVASARPSRCPAAGCGTARRTAVAHLLQDVGRAGIAHEGRARGAPDRGAGKARRDEGRGAPCPPLISASTSSR